MAGQLPTRTRCHGVRGEFSATGVVSKEETLFCQWLFNFFDLWSPEKFQEKMQASLQIAEGC